MIAAALSLLHTQSAKGLYMYYWYIIYALPSVVILVAVVVSEWVSAKVRGAII